MPWYIKIYNYTCTKGNKFGAKVIGIAIPLTPTFLFTLYKIFVISVSISVHKILILRHKCDSNSWYLTTNSLLQWPIWTIHDHEGSLCDPYLIYMHTHKPRKNVKECLFFYIGFDFALWLLSPTYPTSF